MIVILTGGDKPHKRSNKVFRDQASPKEFDQESEGEHWAFSNPPFVKGGKLMKSRKNLPPFVKGDRGGFRRAKRLQHGIEAVGWIKRSESTLSLG